MKTALVTGGAKGIGQAIVRNLCASGFSVAINYNKSEEKALALSSELISQGFDVFCVKADLSKPEEIKNMVNTVAERNGRIDVLVNNAGVEYWGLFDNMSQDEIAFLTAVNFTAPHLVAKEVIPLMLKNKYGRIINISSIWGQLGASCEVMYSSAKAGIIGFTKALSKELAPSGITVNCVCPGATDTDMMKRFSPEEIAGFCEEVPCGRLASPDEVAHAVGFFADEKSGFITGQILGVNGGMC